MMRSFSVMLQISEEQIAGLLCNAFEGGSNYWIEECSHRPYQDKQDPSLLRLNLPCWVKPMEDSRRYWLRQNSIEAGLRRMAEGRLDGPGKEGGKLWHFADWLGGNDDATTGDVFLQLCLFGEVLYG